jgi:hypothetical protein
MTLAELAQQNGLSLSSAKRYVRQGVDLRDAGAVEAHKAALRTRRGVGKRSKRHREPEPANPEIDLELVILDVHFDLMALRSKYPAIAADIDQIFRLTGPVVCGMC